VASWQEAEEVSHLNSSLQYWKIFFNEKCLEKMQKLQLKIPISLPNFDLAVSAGK